MANLTKKDENIENLWGIYRSTGDVVCRDRLVEHYLFLVKVAIGRFVYSLPSYIGREDLESYGIVGLLQAFDRFQPEKGLKFETYALSRIRGAVLDYLRSLDPMTRGQRKMFKEVMATWNHVQSQIGRDPTLDELSSEMGLTVQEISWIVEQNRSTMFLSLDQEKGEDGKQVGEDIADGRLLYNPQELIENKALLEHLAQNIDALPDREKLCIALYYYEGLTLKEIGKVLGVGEPRVSQILSQAVIRLRVKMVEWES
ncbi:MAG: FliA/WhiG family RNA polymerase sigma factor [Candidatus Atribacteria bacterium]|nr:FliA/WhiG family RNA polymerase sigma factor [Candidatus Atribacteria bacterium]